MATSLTGVGAVWASLSLIAAILCCSGFYLPFWIQISDQMSETNKDNNAKAEEPKAGEKILDLTNIVGKACTEKEVLFEGESSTNYSSDFEPVKNKEDSVLQNPDDSFEENPEIFDSVTNPLYVAWWNYLRKNKGKKKKRKLLEIYRDENYWADDKCSEDEFDYAEA